MTKKLTFLPNRRFILAAIPAFLAVGCSDRSGHAQISAPEGAGLPPDPSGIDWASLTEEEWRARLSDDQFYVLREEGTERAFTSALNDEHRDGVFHCAGCDLPLFSSDAKYNSGTGWPSFFEPLPNAMETKPDNRLWMTRTEYHCMRCKGHQGHVFSDGPPPTGQRWCNNGVALTFRPA
ncbi:peptide-methionine (R)-S-oxide reductase MsrB [Ponticaulis sp.]|uniref:peptide-methionine (R)-S-oxide reductase MsrB n=1 Tax=Ponticaulis sp. TaxID=2020902 RepID=UPI000B698C1E|nr:peptide-methionine (R)-S-oxide reductase MsrB [Ponticaulis sp.]MAI91629.1 peptide-methionine (R)-S-oxide reductase [Ponticaulis sp.]OUX97195.1 MAG: peptide-methionine (R)-S-oxide reductase [Hyphomonadaceae bacterium TMED5]|tara:strand:- start:21044 stop:21580 length:537 start_codon:yes stop_codon:yes gene_type:complete